MPAHKHSFKLAWAAAALLAVTVFNAVCHQPFQQPVLLDFSMDYYFAQEIGKGKVLYKDVWDHKTPLTRYLAAGCYLLHRLVPSVDFIVAVRFLFIGLLFLTSLVIFGLAGEWFQDDWIALFASLVFILQNDIMNFACSGPASKLLMNLMGLCSLWMISRRKFLGAGVFAGLAFLDWQPGIGYLAPFILYLFYQGKTLDPVKAVFKYLLGFCLPIVLFLIYFHYHNAFGDFINSTFWFNILRVPRQFDLRENLFFSKLLKLRESVWFISGLIICLIYPVLRMADKARNRFFSDKVYGNLDQLYVLTIFTVLYSFINFNDLRDTTPFAPLIALWLAGLFGVGAEIIFPAGKDYFINIYRTAAVGCFVIYSLRHMLAFNLYTPFRVIDYKREKPLVYVRHNFFTRDFQEKYIRELLKESSGKMLVIWPLEFLVLKDLSNPIPFPCFTENSYSYIEKFHKKGWRGIMDKIKALSPDTIVIRPSGRGDPVCMADLRDFIKENHYRLRWRIDKPDGPAFIYLLDQSSKAPS